MINKINKLKIQIFADGADFYSMKSLSKKKFIKGLTTNPSLMRKAGVKDYVNFSKKVLMLLTVTFGNNFLDLCAIAVSLYLTQIR